MRDVCIKLSQEMDRQGYTNARMALESGVSETTIRRVRAAEGSVSIETGVAIARILNLSLDEITGLMTPPAAAALAAIEDTVREDLEEKYKPNSEHCATTCPARKAMDANVDKIENLYKERMAEVDTLYERSIKRKDEQINKQEAEIVSLRDGHKQELAALRAEHRQELAALRAEHRQELANVREEMEALRERKDIRIARFRWVSLIAVILLIASLAHSVWAVNKIVKLNDQIDAIEIVE